MNKNYSFFKFAYLLFILTLISQINLARSEADDSENFKRINRDILMHRTADDIGNRFSVRHPGMRIKSPQLNGSGCPTNETSVVLSYDKRAISILFDHYSLELGGSSGIRRLEKFCKILIPVEIPQGHRVSVVALDYRGFVSLPLGAMASVMAIHRFYHQSSSLPFSRRFIRHDQFIGLFDDEYILTSSLKNKMQWSDCGQSMALEIQTQLKAQTNSALEEALATLDSIDGQSSDDLTYHLLWEKC